MPLLVLSTAEVARHCDATDCWVAIDGKVYDVTAFLARHPGGKAVLAGVGGQDVTRLFLSLHNSHVQDEIAAEFLLGRLGESITAPTRRADGGDDAAGHPNRESPLPNPKDAYPNPLFPRSARWLAARWQPEDDGLPLSLKPLSAEPGHSGGTGMIALQPQHWFELDKTAHQRKPDQVHP